MLHHSITWKDKGTVLEQKLGCSRSAKQSPITLYSRTVWVSTGDKFSLEPRHIMVDRFVIFRWPYVRSLLEAHRATAVNEVSPRGSIDSLIGDRRTSAGSAASRSILCLNFFSSGHSSSVIWHFFFYHFLIIFSRNIEPRAKAATLLRVRSSFAAIVVQGNSRPKDMKSRRAAAGRVSICEGDVFEEPLLG